MRECEYPPCHEPSVGWRALNGDKIFLCKGHAAIIDRNRADEEHDFWRWADAMMNPPGRG
jgi:hypothetical protein